MQLSVAEDLLKNADDWAVVIGDMLEAVSDNVSITSMTVTPPQENIGMQCSGKKMYYTYVFKYKYIHTTLLLINRILNTIR